MIKLLINGGRFSRTVIVLSSVVFLVAAAMVAVVPTKAATVINVKNLGATGNGTSDDYGPINSALSQACSANGAVYFPPGTYLVSAPLNSVSGCNITVYGDGSNTSVIKLGGPGSSAYSPVLSFSGTSNTVYVHDIGVYGQHVHAVGMQFTSLGTAYVYNVVVKDFGTPGYSLGNSIEEDGIYIQYVQHVNVSNSVITGNERSGIEMIPATYATIQGNIINGNGYYASAGEWLDPSGSSGPLDNEYINNIAKNNGGGGFDVETGSNLTPAYGKIHGNDIEDNGNDMWTYGIGAVVGNNAYGDISNNIVHDFNISGPQFSGYGTAIWATPVGPLTMTNNYESNSRDNGITVNGYGYPVTITGNWTTGNPSVGLSPNTFSGGTINNNYSYGNSGSNFAISGCNSCTTTPNYTSVPNDTVAPSVPTGLSASGSSFNSGPSFNQLNLSWNDSTDNIGVKGYYLYRNGVQIAMTAGTQYPDTNLAPGTSYTYTVAAFDGSGNVSAQSAAITGVTLGGSGNTPPDTIPPSVPTGLAGSAVSTSQVNLSWAASTDNVGVTGYKIYRNGTQIATTAGTSYNDTGLAAATTYTYTVAAYDAAGNTSAQSAGVSIKTLSNTGPGTNVASGLIATTAAIFLPPAGTTLTAAIITDGDITTSNWIEDGSGPQWIKFDLKQAYTLNDIKVWHYYGDGRSYHGIVVQVSNDPNFATGVTTVFNNDTTNGVGQGVGSNAEYVETAAGKDIPFSPVSARYVRLWSNGNTVNFYNHYVEVQVFAASSTDTIPPSVPTGLSASAVSTSQVNLSWAASTDNVGVTGYKIYRNGTQIATTAGTSYNDTGLTPSSVNSYTVAAYDAAGNTSAQSGSVTIITNAVTTSVAVGQTVVTTARLNVRQTSSINGTYVNVEAVGAAGTVIGGPIAANGYTWWQINWANGVSGWSIGNYLQGSLGTTVGMGAKSPILANSMQALQLLQNQLQNLSNVSSSNIQSELANISVNFQSILNALKQILP